MEKMELSLDCEHYIGMTHQNQAMMLGLTDFPANPNNPSCPYFCKCVVCEMEEE